MSLVQGSGFEEVFLKPGDFFFGGGRTRISTLLGSCVSITLWHPRQRIGGMCHYLLTERQRPPRAPLDGRFANEAFEMFLLEVSGWGTRPSDYQAKIFGGARMLSGPVDGRLDIGANNVAYGRQWLASGNIPVIAEHVGGSGRRKLCFDLWTGDVWLAFPQGEGAQIRSEHG